MATVFPWLLGGLVVVAGAIFLTYLWHWITEDVDNE